MALACVDLEHASKRNDLGTAARASAELANAWADVKSALEEYLVVESKA